MASTTGTNAEGNFPPLKSVEGSKPTNARKRQLTNRDAEKSSSTKRSSVDVDLTADESQSAPVNEAQRQGDNDAELEGEWSSDQSSDEDDGESQPFKKPRNVPSNATPEVNPPVAPPVADVKKDKQRKKSSTKQSARTSGSAGKTAVGGASSSSSVTTSRNQSNMSMDSLNKIRQQLKKIDVDKLAKMLQGEGLTEFPKGTLFEVSAIQRRNGEHGEYGELTYVATVNSKRKAGKVRVPETALCNLQSDGPCLMYYAGPKTTMKGRTCHDISIMRVPDVTTAEQMKVMADKLRSLGPVGTKANMSGVPLDNFPINTLFSFKNPRMQPMGMEKKELLVVDFETDSKDGTTSGQLFLPARLESDAKATGSGLLLYRGPRLSQEGRTYHDVLIFSPKTAYSLMMNVSD